MALVELMDRPEGSTEQESKDAAGARKEAPVAAA
jgi:hypothetical protein